MQRWLGMWRMPPDMVAVATRRFIIREWEFHLQCWKGGAIRRQQRITNLSCVTVRHDFSGQWRLFFSYVFIIFHPHPPPPNHNVRPDSQLCSGCNFTSFNKKGFKGRITAQDVIRGDDLTGPLTRHGIKTANPGAFSKIFCLCLQPQNLHEHWSLCWKFSLPHHPFLLFGALSLPRW